MSSNLRQRIYKLKTTIVALVSFGVGLALQIFAGAAVADPNLSWVGFWQVSSIGGTLFAAGLFGIVWDYFDGKDKEERDTERLKRVLADSSSELKDAVIEGFAVGSADLKRVATPELLDSIATNALALRLDDEAFAREIYQDVRDQAIRARERWYDVQVSIRLSDAATKDHTGTPRFDLTVQWEYTVTPSTSVQKFACTSDRDEFHELLADIPATSTWFMTPRPGFQANSRDAFELLQYSVDGEDRAIRRSERKTGQTYSVSLGADVIRNAQPVRIRHMYRTITDKSNHRIFLAIAQPTRGLSLTMDYTDTDIARMSVTDLISSAKRPFISRTPEEVAAKQITVDAPGWLLPQAEVTFVWTLASEEPSLRSESAEEPTAARAA
ncbi:hypothetical protein [Herbiconiux liangxiaofengii]|uniref:hypothetical protein n=1 Tax=Herbiconiux liangxiaofengii TaxID=3342795 RepID=UPI0035BB7C86